MDPVNGGFRASLISETETARRLVADAKLRVEQAERVLGVLALPANRNTFQATYAQLDNLEYGIKKLMENQK